MVNRMCIWSNSLAYIIYQNIILEAGQIQISPVILVLAQWVVIGIVGSGLGYSAMKTAWPLFDFILWVLEINK